MPLAIGSYESLDALADDDRTLNLAWTLDERAYLAVDPAEVAAAELRAELGECLRFVRTYFVRDPYGDAMMREAVAAFFSLPSAAFRVTCGAGVDSLLHAYAHLALGGPAYALGEIYPDFPHWVSRLSSACRGGSDLHRLADELRSARAAVLLVERPALVGDDLTLVALAELCRAVAPLQTIVLVDESYANYCEPSYSAVALVATAPNIGVLRGVSKGYGMGGLRLGYCVASAVTTERLRAVLAPMQVSSLSLRIARALLECGDIGEPLRRRAGEAKRELAEALRSAGIGDALRPSAHVPYAFSATGEVAAPRLLEGAGIVGKPQPFWTAAGGVSTRYRLSAPLLPERMERLRALLRAGARP